jgi:molecular chaperone GrpE
VRLVLRQFTQALERCGVTPVTAQGVAFDPTQHEAVSQRETDEVPPGTVVGVLQSGYRICERLLRPALVVVAKTPPAPARDPAEGNGHADAADEPPGPNGHDPDAA